MLLKELRKIYYMLSEVITTEIKENGKHDKIEVIALFDSAYAEDIAFNLPTTIVSACENVSKFVQVIFMKENLHVYTHNDVKGVELCGTLKNIVVLAT